MARWRRQRVRAERLARGNTARGRDWGIAKGARGKASYMLANVVQILALKHYIIEIICVSERIRTMAFAFEGHASSLCESAVPATVRKVEQKAERHPNDEPFPGDGREL